MKVFKFGGASVKNPEGIKNLLSLVKKSNNERLLLLSLLWAKLRML
jgi:aspartokinase